MTTKELTIHLRNPSGHQYQLQALLSKYKRLMLKAGRRGAKTVTLATKGVNGFLEQRRVLYAAPTSEQTDKFWYEIKRALREPIDAKVLKCNETERFIEVPGTENRIKAKTAWNANTLRGDYADLLLFDEFQLMDEDAWDEVGAPMLMDNNGAAVFAFTPPSLKSSGISRAKDPRHASKLFKQAQADTSGLWECIHFTSYDNPFISQEGLALVTKDMSLDAYRREIMAEDDEIELSWLVYGKFNELQCKVARREIPKTWPIYTGHDFGASNPAALFIARDPGTGDFYVFKEYLPGPGISIACHVDEFKSITEGYEVTKRVGGSHQEEEIRQGYTAHSWPIVEPRWDKRNPQIERTQALIERNQLYIFEDLHRVLAEISNCMWELDSDNQPTKGKIKDEHKYHLLAALRYIASDFTPETVDRSRQATTFSVRRR